MPDDEPTAAPTALLTACKMLLQDCNCGLLPPSLGAIDRVKAAVELAERGEHDAATPPSAADALAATPGEVERLRQAMEAVRDMLVIPPKSGASSEAFVDPHKLQRYIDGVLADGALAATAPHPAPTAAAGGVDLANELHGVDMHEPCKPSDTMRHMTEWRDGYLEGHRDARHAIAEALVSHPDVRKLDALAAEVAALRSGGAWVPVASGSLPAPFEVVLVCFDTGQRHVAYWRDHTALGREWCCGDDRWDFKEVTHWQPLPALPSGGGGHAKGGE